jgi:tRNA-specific 2-thiouridylase
MTRGRVVVALSGGVDSAVAAARLVDAGHDVVGVTLHLWDYPDDGSVRGRCCAPEDQYDARAVCDSLGIPFYAFDRRELFRTEVVDPFVQGYLRGETPSPCVACNRTVKLRELLPLADRLGASAIATGHYARVLPDSDGVMRLHRAIDRQKDQSYFLHMLRPDELARLVLPLGDATKPEVRAEAERRGLPVAGKGESQELCFVPSGRYDRFVEERADGRVRPGPVLDASGRELGRHEGVHRFTLGQRKGLGVALGAPAYVVGIDAESGAVRVGSESELDATGAVLEGVVLHGHALPLEATVRVRARHEGERATLTQEGDGVLHVRFERPVRAVTVGQVAVAYRGDEVLGGGRIARALP